MNPDPTRPPPSNAVAIIGMAGRFPGAPDLATFWKKLREGEEGLTRIERSALPAEVRDDPAYVPARGVLEGAAGFDAAFFGISPREAAVMDPQQRVFLECCWHALEDSGRIAERGSLVTGIFAGQSLNTYLLANLAHDRAFLDRITRAYQTGEFSVLFGNDPAFLATRVAHRLDLRGPAISVGTACSTSLVAVVQAVNGLLSFQCDLCLAGGVSISFPQERGHRFEEGSMVSPDGHCRPFDAAAAGTVFSAGVGVVVLRRLEDALAAGDRIHAVIRGAAVNNDGAAKASFSAPGVEGQCAAITTALTLADVPPDSIGLVEAHGTGTPLGDPVEVAALARAFRDCGATGKQTCALGSLKSNFGHMEAAAGVAGLIKAALAVRDGVLPATLHFARPNPHIDFSETPFRVSARTGPWPDAAHPRRAGVSSFGVGGTNAHVVLEEPPASPAPDASPEGRPFALLVGARSPEAALRMAAALADHFEDGSATDPADAAATLALHREPMPHRLAVTARDRGEAVAALRSVADKAVVEAPAEAPPVVFVFPGQGAQRAGMARDLHETEPVFREVVEDCARLLGNVLRDDVRPLILAAHDDERAAQALRRTRFTQPCLFVTELALARLWESWGVRPAALIGHSVGEYVAACLAGVLSQEDALAAVAERGALVQEQPAGAMLSVRLGETALAPLLPAGCEIAAINAPGLCVVAGPEAAVAVLEGVLAARGHAHRRLPTSHAFHSAMMDPVVAPLRERIGRMSLHAPAIPIVSTVTGAWMTEGEATRADYWARHARLPVRFEAGLATVLERAPAIVLEVGPGQTLCQLARLNSRAGRAIDVVASQPLSGDHPLGALEITRAAARLWERGVPVDWSARDGGRRRPIVSLPGYRFARDRHWVDAPAVGIAEPSPSIPAPVAAGAPNPPAADGGVSTELLGILESVSGNPVRPDDAGAGFLELGFDSLLLTQVTTLVREHFGVAITFRQLLEDFTTPAALAAHLEARRAARPIATTRPAAPRPASAEEAPAPARHGPFRAIEKVRGEELSGTQRRHLDTLIAAYCARTAGSKRHAAEHRAHFTDPRAMSGFRPLWKEMVYPIVCARSRGPNLWDVDGNAYLDITMGFGVAFFGHTPDFISEAIRRQLESGAEIGPQTPLAGEAARLLCEMTGMERATFCNTGSEAVMAAMRVARTVTGRSKIVLFAGDYHGMFDSVLVRGVARDGEPHTLPIAPGIPRGLIEDIVVLDYGADDALAWIRAHGRELAAVVVEPVQSRNPALQPRAFLHALRELTRASGTALVFDEVITGFRCAPGGAQAWFGVEADLATYGKVIGGGMPIGALAGRRRWMDALDGGAWNYGDDSVPEVGVTFFAGTFVRHPLAMAACLASLRRLREEGPALQEAVNARVARLARELNAFFAERAVEARVDHFASVFRIEFAPRYPHAGLFFFHLRLRGVHFWEGRVGFLSTTHTDAEVDTILATIREAVLAMREGGFLPTPESTADAEAPGAQIPLTEEQREMWLACQMGPEIATSYNESGILRFAAPLDEAALARALRTVVDRHEGLRATFAADGSGQTIHPRMEVALRVLDRPADPRDHAGLLRAEAAGVFDIEHGPGLRVLLLRDPAATELVVTVCHLACDGWSFNTVLRELAACYAAFVGGRAPDLAPPARLSVFAAAEPRRNASPEGRAALENWRAELAGMPPCLELPTDRPRPEEATFAAGRETLRIDPEASRRIRAFARSNRATTFSLLFSVFGILMHRLTGARDLLVGVPVAGQHVHDAPSLVGHCVNYLPIRHRVDPEDAPAEHLRKTAAALARSFEHARISFGRLLREIKWPRDPRRPSPLSVTFNLDPPMGVIDFGGTTPELIVNPVGRIDCDLSLNIVDEAQGLFLEADYRAELFEAETVRRWLRLFSEMLETAGDATEARVLNTAEAAPGPPVTERLLHELFEDRAAISPEAVAVEYEDESLTYRALDARANRLARHLAELGAAPGACVAVGLERSLEFVVALLATLKAGATFVPIDPTWPDERRSRVIRECGARLLVARTASLPADLPAATTCVDPVADAGIVARRPDSRPAVATPAGALAYVIFTSGSSGAPKGVMVGHRAIAAHIASIARVYGLSERDACLLFPSVAFDPTIEQAFSAFHVGARLVVRPQTLWNGAAFAARVRRHRLTVVDLPPRYLLQLLREWKAEGAAPDLGPLRLILAGGESLPPAAVALWRGLGLTAIRLINAYGPTECAVTATTHEIPATPAAVEPGGRIPVGKPHGPVEALILDDDLRPVPTGVRGELCLAGPTLALGYLGRDDLTAAAFLPHPLRPAERIYRTGDAARRLADGTIEFLERIDRQVQVRGFRVEPGEIEARLVEHPAVAGAVVVAGSGVDGSVELTAYLEPAPGGRPTHEALREHLAGGLPAYMIPARFLAVATLPVDGNGKLDTRSLASLPTREIARATVAPAAAGPTEEALVAIWRGLLRRGQVGIRDDFFELGGHSLLAMQMIREIATRFDHALTLAQLLGAPTIEAIARRIDAAAPARPTAPREARASRGTILFNVPGIFGYGLLPAPLARAVAADRPTFDGLQLPGADGRERPLETLEEMAAHLIGQIRAVQERGPYALTGFCFGGLLAYEIACQLQRAGETVRGLVLWHAFPWYLWKRRSFARALLEAPRELRGVVAAPVKRLAEILGLRRAEPDPAAERPPIYHANARAGDRYRIRTPYTGRLHVARALRLEPGVEGPPQGGWELVDPGALTVHDFDCAHLEFVSEPWLSRLSGLTAEWLREADRETGPRPTPAAGSRTGFPRPLSARGPAAEGRRPAPGSRDATIAG